MLVFIILAGFIALILNRQIARAFMANPPLNGLIFGVMFVGMILGLRQVFRLFPEIRWANSLGHPQAEPIRPPVLLAPMATILSARNGEARGISALTMRAMLDSVGMRLDESREIARYLTGLLIFLGLLGTFWGLLETVGSISGVIKNMQTSGDTSVMFDELKSGLAAPISGMSVSFTSSLFGLAGSLILGFLDLQAGQAQNRFYNELEDKISTFVDEAAPTHAGGPGVPAVPADMRALVEKLAAGLDPARSSTAAMANLAEGIQALVQHMRSEQQLIRDWVEAQADQNAEVRRLLERLTREREMR